MIRKALFAMLGALAALAVGGAGAYFTAQVQVPNSVIRAGSVAISTQPTSAPLAIDALAPGTSAVRPMSVVNDGSLPSDIIVTAKKPPASPRSTIRSLARSTAEAPPSTPGPSPRCGPCRSSSRRGRAESCASRWVCPPTRATTCRRTTRRCRSTSTPSRRTDAPEMVRSRWVAWRWCFSVAVGWAGLRATGSRCASPAPRCGRRWLPAISSSSTRAPRLRPGQSCSCDRPGTARCCIGSSSVEPDGSVRTQGDANPIADFDDLPSSAVRGSGGRLSHRWGLVERWRRECRGALHMPANRTARGDDGEDVSHLSRPTREGPPLTGRGRTVGSEAVHSISRDLNAPPHAGASREAGSPRYRDAAVRGPCDALRCDVANEWVAASTRPTEVVPREPAPVLG